MGPVSPNPRASIARTFAKRRMCRSAPVKRADKNVWTSSSASPSPITLPPRQKTFISSSSTPWRAENASWISPARTSAIFLATMLAPTPLPQIAIPRSISPEAIDLAREMI